MRRHIPFGSSGVAFYKGTHKYYLNCYPTLKDGVTNQVESILHALLEDADHILQTGICWIAFCADVVNGEA